MATQWGRLAALLTYPTRALRWRVEVWRAQRALAVAEQAWSLSYASRDLYAECCAADDALEAVLAARPTLWGAP